MAQSYRDQVLDIVRTQHAGFVPTLAHEKLVERSAPCATPDPATSLCRYLEPVEGVLGLTPSDVGVRSLPCVSGSGPRD